MWFQKNMILETNAVTRNSKALKFNVACKGNGNIIVDMAVTENQVQNQTVADLIVSDGKNMMNGNADQNMIKQKPIVHKNKMSVDED